MNDSLLKGKRVFVVEDDVVNMAITAVLLKNQGAIVIQDAWNSGTPQLLRERLPVDTILLDLMLRHGASGYDIYSQIRADPQLAGIPIVAVSASDPHVEIPRAQMLGLDGFIGKPIDLHRFGEQVLSCLNHTSVWEAH
jgi:CheY-like chemotaxis protein